MDESAEVDVIVEIARSSLEITSGADSQIGPKVPPVGPGRLGSIHPGILLLGHALQGCRTLFSQAVLTKMNLNSCF